MEATQPDRSEVDLPEPIIEFFEADIELRQHVTHIDPAAAPAHPAVATHPPHFIMPWVADRQERAGIGPRRSVVQTCGQPLAERFVWSLRVAARRKPIKASLLGGERAAWRPRRLGLGGLGPPLRAARLFGVRGPAAT